MKLADFLYQGDIVLTVEQADSFMQSSSVDGDRRKRQAYVDLTYFPKTLWINPIAYRIDAGLSMRQ